MPSINEEIESVKRKRAKTSGVGAKVLLVEDEERLAQAYGDGLRRENFTVSLACNGKEAIELMRNNRYDIVLLDLFLPLVDGFEVLRIWHNDGVLAEVPVIVLSNQGEDDNVRQCIELGASGFLLKTDHSLDEIVSIIRNNLK